MTGAKIKPHSSAARAAILQVVSDQIGIRHTGNESDAKKVSSDLDKGIDKNLDAALVQRKLKDGVSYDVNNGVVTLKGNTSSQSAPPAGRKDCLGSAQREAGRK
jgi:hypothetical protein